MVLVPVPLATTRLHRFSRFVHPFVTRQDGECCSESILGRESEGYPHPLLASQGRTEPELALLGGQSTLRNAGQKTRHSGPSKRLPRDRIPVRRALLCSRLSQRDETLPIGTAESHLARSFP